MKNTIPLSVPCFQGNERKYVDEAVSSEWVSSVGSYVSRFEKDIAHYNAIQFAVACSSGTTALHIALLESGIGPSDEVIVPTITFIATVNAVRYVGAIPVFMDCDDYLNIDVKKVEEFFEKECFFNGIHPVNKRTKNKIRAVLPVHVFGHLVNIEDLMQISDRYNLIVIEDATESLGSYYKIGNFKNRKSGTIGKFGCYSFNGNKIITTGSGGMVVTKNRDSAAHMKYLTTQAKDDERLYVHDEIGYNYRMTNLQAALGVAQLELLDKYIKIKRENFKRYQDNLEGYKGLSFIKEPDYSASNHWFYSLIVDKDTYGLSSFDLMEKLEEEHIVSRPLWYLNHLQKPYKQYQAYKIEKAYWYYERVLNIPCSVNLNEEEISRVISCIKK